MPLLEMGEHDISTPNVDVPRNVVLCLDTQAE